MASSRCTTSYACHHWFVTARWAIASQSGQIANLGSLGTEARIKGIVELDRPLSIEDEDFLKQSLLDVGTLRYFTRHAKDLRWLEWISAFPELAAIFVPGATPSESSAELAVWFAEQFAIPHFAVAIDLVRRKGQTLSPHLWIALALAFHHHGTAGDPLRFWVPILLETMPVNANPDFLAYMIDHCTIPDDYHTILQLFRKLSTPRLKVQRSFFPPENGKPAVPDGEVVPIGEDFWMRHAYQTRLRPNLDTFAKGLGLTVTTVFEEARALLLMYGKAGARWDPISFSRGSVASQMQDHLHNGFSVLIDAGFDILQWANEHDRNFSWSLIEQWIESDAQILQRLAISGMTGYPTLTTDDKLSWAISNRVIENSGLKNETFELLAKVYGASSEKVRAKFLAQAEAAMNPAGEDVERYQFFNLLSWLRERSPECALVQEKLQPIQERHPEWTVREHPNFDSWMTAGYRQVEPDSLVPPSQIAEMNLEAVIAESTRLASIVNDPFGDSPKDGFFEGIARAATANFAWSERIAGEALARADVPFEVWSALLRGWSSAHSVEEWGSVLAIVERLEPMYSSAFYEISLLLKDSVEREEIRLPISLFHIALARANAVWAVCAAHEEPLPKEAEDWVSVAINQTSGYLLEFYLGALRLLWPNRGNEEALIQSIFQTLELAIDGDSPTSEVARVLISAKAALLAEFSEDWYSKHVLPLLATPKTPRSSEQSWDGFLVWGSWTQAMLPGLIPAYMRHLTEIVAASNDRSRMFCEHLAGFAIFGAIDPIGSGWLDEFLTRSTHRERISWAENITQTLRGADDQAKESAWSRWIGQYLRRRVEANPLPLNAEESGAMCEWALILESHYAEILELLLAGPAPESKRNMFYYRLHEEKLLERAPALTARFLMTLLSREDGHEFWYLDQVHAMVSQLIDLDPTEPALRPLCEQLGGLGSPRALEFEGRLQ